MASFCPCGCGAKLGFTDRGIAKQAVYIDERLGALQLFADASVSAGGAPDNIQAFMDEGRQHHADLIDVVHGADARLVDRQRMHQWIKAADAALRKA